MSTPALSLLLLSSSRVADGDYLQTSRSLLANHFHRCQRILFIPFASVQQSNRDYGAQVSAALPELAGRIRVLHADDDGSEQLAQCDGVMVGGGNTFVLLDRLYRHGLVRELRDAVRAGLPYAGWSAGSNIAAPTIRTTNDMPVIEPPSLAALNLVPFQLNPHYHNINLPGFHGETRRERLAEFIALNPDCPLLALPEGCGLAVSGEQATVVGDYPALRLAADDQDQPLPPGYCFALNAFAASQPA